MDFDENVLFIFPNLFGQQKSGDKGSMTASNEPARQESAANALPHPAPHTRFFKVVIIVCTVQWYLLVISIVDIHTGRVKTRVFCVIVVLLLQFHTFHTKTQDIHSLYLAWSRQLPGKKRRLDSAVSELQHKETQQASFGRLGNQQTSQY
jgi:hypothetical protein